MKFDRELAMLYHRSDRISSLNDPLSVDNGKNDMQAERVYPFPFVITRRGRYLKKENIDAL